MSAGEDKTISRMSSQKLPLFLLQSLPKQMKRILFRIDRKSSAANQTGDKMTVLDEPLLSGTEAADILKQKPATMPMWRHLGKGPPYLKIGKRVFYRPSDIRTYINQQLVVPSARGAA
jgi:hypothetical protein